MGWYEKLFVIVIDYGKWLNYLLALIFVWILNLDFDWRLKKILLCMAGGAICICLLLQIRHCLTSC